MPGTLVAEPSDSAVGAELVERDGAVGIMSVDPGCVGAFEDGGAAGAERKIGVLRSCKVQGISWVVWSLGPGFGLSHRGSSAVMS